MRSISQRARPERCAADSKTATKARFESVALWLERAERSAPADLASDVAALASAYRTPLDNPEPAAGALLHVVEPSESRPR